MMETSDHSTGDPRNRAMWRNIVIGLILLGALFRLSQYFSNQAFWEDEAAVLINVQHHPARELPFIKLESYDPASPVAAPPLFLWATQWMGNYAGYHEWSTRLVPLLCSLAALGLFSLLAWRCLHPSRAAACAVALFALSDPLIFQAANVKPYSGDVLAAVVILFVAYASPRASALRRLTWASIVTAVAIWLSYAAVFTLAAVGLALLAQLPRRTLRDWLRIILAGAPAALSFLIVYFLCMRAQREDNLDFYWAHLFPNFKRYWTIPGFFIGGTWDIFRFIFYPIGFILLLVAGLAICFLRAGRPLLILLLAPLVLNVIASCIHQYPYGGTRLTLFMAPSLCLLVAVGVIAIPKYFSRKSARITTAIIAIVPLTMLVSAIYGIFVPQNKGNLRDALTYLNAHRQPGEEVYLVGNQTLGAAKWYWPNPDPLVHAHLTQSEPLPTGRYWVVIAWDSRKFKENAMALKQPGCRADPARHYHINGADVQWFEPSP